MQPTKVIPEFSTMRLSYIVRRVMHYTRTRILGMANLYLSGPNGSQCLTEERTDFDDGSPHIARWELISMAAGAHSSDLNARYWTAKVSYYSWGEHRGEPDYYVTTTFQNRKIKCGFHLNESYLVQTFPLLSGGLDSVRADLIWLESRLHELDKHTESLDSWASSGMDMIAICVTGCTLHEFNPCRHMATIPNKVLSSAVAKGQSLDVFRSKMRCKRCGERNVNIAPPAFANFVEN